MMTPLELIDAPARNVRRIAATPAEDLALLESIKARGVLQPVLLRPSAESNGRFVIIDGLRRVTQARAAELAAIPAEVRKGTDDTFDAVDGVAANTVRVGMAPVDIWRAMVRLQEEGHTLAHCAASLGLTMAMAKRLDRLGRLHPDVIEAIAAFGLPDDDDLREMLLAPFVVQAAAIKHLRVLRRDELDQDGPEPVSWYEVVNACQHDRIPSTRAIFDWKTSSVVFEEDLFTPENDEDHWTTSDVAGFLSLQRATLDERLAGNKHSLIIGCTKWGQPAVPNGWETVSACSWPDTKIMKRGEKRAWYLNETGHYAGRVVGVVIRPTAKAAARPAATIGDDQHDDVADQSSDDGAEGDAITPEPDEPKEDASRLTKAGLQLVADAKTEAVRSRLRARGGEMEPGALLALLVIALTARTVTVQADTASSYGRTTFNDLLPDVLTPEGEVVFASASDPSRLDICSVAAEAIARILKTPGPDSQPDTAVEWIGHAIDAVEAFGRFDTAEFLAQCRLPVLRAAARDVEGSGNYKTAKGLREYLEGKTSEWLPLEADFGARGPEVRP